MVPESHPAPHARFASLFVLVFGLAGGAAGWIAQLVVGYGLSAYLCQPGGEVRRSALSWPGEQAALLAVNLTCLTLAGASFAVAFRAWRRTRHEKSGDAHVLTDIGEGRTRFLALCGMVASSIFAVAILFNTAPIIGVPACWALTP